jgi:raffinose/stachyose/melibiose transport system permease protein
MKMKNKKNKYNSKVTSYIILTIASLIIILPLWYVINNAFKKKEFILQNPMLLTIKTFTFDNIKNAFVVMNYPQALLNNLIILIISCVLLVVVGSITGYSITMSESKILQKYYIFVVAIITIPFMTAMVPLISLMNTLGLTNTYFGVSIVFTAFYLPFVIFLYKGYMTTLPKELYEAAVIDGCGFFKTYLYIYMPLLKTITGTVLILKGVSVWNDLLIPLVTITNQSMTPLNLELYSFASVRLTSWDLVFAGTLLVALPIMIIFLLFQRVFIQGIADGAVKG